MLGDGFVIKSLISKCLRKHFGCAERRSRRRSCIRQRGRLSEAKADFSGIRRTAGTLRRPMRVLSKSLAAMVAAATLVGGGAFAVAGTAYAADNDAITVTPNPWYANSFDG